MSRLVPTSTTAIPVSDKTEGSDAAKLVVEKHEFAAPQQPAREKIVYLWSHANGFSKELMHPLMRRFLTQLRKLEQYNNTDVHFIAWDARNHGDSARLNEGIHNPKFNWFDNAMDTKQIIDELELKSYDKLIGVGHSFGATAMILCEFLYPGTFDGLTLIEPVIHGDLPPHALRVKFPAIAVTLKRRDTWDSREACMKSLAGRPFWKAFHPEALENYVQYALYDTTDGKVKLKCPKEEEHVVYINGSYGALTAFAALRAIKIPLHFVHANSSGYVDPEFGKVIKEQSSFVTNAYVDGSHVVPLENPDILVPEIIHLSERVRKQTAQAKL